jgi:hypothetical protein
LQLYPKFSGYKIYAGEAPRLYSQTFTVGNVTSSTVNNLAVGHMYYWAVTAYNGAGEISLSNEVKQDNSMTERSFTK